MNFFESLRDIIINIFTKFSFSTLVTMLMGILIGFFLAITVYLSFVLSSLKKQDKEIEKEKYTVTDTQIEKIIKSAKNEYVEESSFLNTGQKLSHVRKISWELIHSIANEYYPDSDYPIYELNGEELLTLVHYITNRVDSIFTGPVLKSFKKIKLAYIFKLLDMKKKIDENKLVKAANKAKVPKIFSTITAVLNVFNPVYWIKKLIVNTAMVAVTNKISLTIIEVVGEETNKVYSKNVFNQEKGLNLEVEKTIGEIEEILANSKE